LRQYASSRPEIPNQDLTRGNQFVGEHVPWTSLESAGAQVFCHTLAILGPNGEIILNDRRLTIEQKAQFAICIEFLQYVVNDVDQALPKNRRRVVPLSVPVRVADYMDSEVRGPALAACWHSRVGSSC
jgi:hypothetical protein